VSNNLKSIAMICFTAISIAGMLFYQARYPIGPPAVVVPVSNIADTIEDERSRAIVAEYCTAWAASMGSVGDLGHYYSARKFADKALQSAGKLPSGLNDFDAELSKRLEAAVGLDPSRTDLEPAAEVFRTVSSELR